jgi:hypothetical protein
MSNGTEGMLRGQAPQQPDAFAAAGMPKRSYRTDTEHEQKAVRPQKTHANSTGYTSQCADLTMMHTMEQAMTDKLNMTMKQGIEDGFNARLEMEEEGRNNQVTSEQIDAAQDSKNIDDDDLEALRNRRRQQMKEKQDKHLKYQSLGHGTYDEIPEEDFLKTVTASERCCVHFYHRSFEKCKVMDMHLSKCAKKFFGTRFVKMESEKAPFFTDKLRIKTLPCVVVFNDGIAKWRQMGFEGLPGLEFETVQLAWRIKELGEGIEEDFGLDDIEMFK